MICASARCRASLAVGEGIGLKAYGLEGPFCLSCVRLFQEALWRARSFVTLVQSRKSLHAINLSDTSVDFLSSGDLGEQGRECLEHPPAMVTAPAPPSPQKLLPARCPTADNLGDLPANEVMVAWPELKRLVKGRLEWRWQTTKDKGSEYGPYLRLVRRWNEYSDGRRIQRTKLVKYYGKA